MRRFDQKSRWNLHLAVIQHYSSRRMASARRPTILTAALSGWLPTADMKAVIIAYVRQIERHALRVMNECFFVLIEIA